MQPNQYELSLPPRSYPPRHQPTPDEIARSKAVWRAMETAQAEGDDDEAARLRLLWLALVRGEVAP